MSPKRTEVPRKPCGKASIVRIQQEFSRDQERTACLIPDFSANACTDLTLKPASEDVLSGFLFFSLDLCGKHSQVRRLG